MDVHIHLKSGPIVEIFSLERISTKTKTYQSEKPSNQFDDFNFAINESYFFVGEKSISINGSEILYIEFTK